MKKCRQNANTHAKIKANTLKEAAWHRITVKAVLITRTTLGVI